MGKKRKPQKKVAAAPAVDDDEIPEGYEVVNPAEWTQRISHPAVVGKKSKKKPKRDVKLDALPWTSLDTSKFEIEEQPPLLLEKIDGSYFESLFMKQKPAKKQKTDLSDQLHDSDSEESEEKVDETPHKKIPMFLAPSVLNKKQKEEEDKRNAKRNSRFSCILAPIKDEEDEAEEIDYQLEENDNVAVAVDGIEEDNDYSDDQDPAEEDETLYNEEKWCGADHRIIKALSNNLSIKEPTTCQQMVLPVALSNRQDVLLAAPTGSGKTFAFGIPILTMIMEILEGQKAKKAGYENITKPFALILAPTRELALQITKNLKIAASLLPKLKVVPIVGGMAAQKQERLLKQNPEIIVGTPGRLWNLLSEKRTLGVKDYPLARFLVIDEADRMVSVGNYKELNNILERMAPWKENKKKEAAVDTSSYDAAELWEQTAEKKTMVVPRQTYICSATLSSSDFVKNFEEGKKLNGKEGTYEGLLSVIDFQRPRRVVDSTTSQMTAENLSEAKLFCILEEKDYYLYYLLNQYPGRTIVFVNSIHCLSRLISLFGLLRFPAFCLHAKMQQKQRLKNLDRFQKNEHCVLLASDVAARGLDIPNIDHVIHYQIPRTAELYVHRSGRTARAMRSGVSVMLVDPSDEATFRKICKLLHKTTADIPDFPIDLRYMKPIRKVVNAAREVDAMLHEKKKNTEDSTWILQMAEEADIDVDHLMEDEDEEEERLLKKEREKLERKKKLLRDLMAQPLVHRGTSTRYITPESVQATSASTAAYSSATEDLKNRNTSKGLFRK